MPLAQIHRYTHPGNTPVSVYGIIGLTLYLLLLIGLILKNLHSTWPKCETFETREQAKADSLKKVNQNSYQGQNASTTKDDKPKGQTSQSKELSSNSNDADARAKAKVDTLKRVNQNTNQGQDVSTTKDGKPNQNTNNNENLHPLRVLSISPTTGPLDGGTLVTIQGSGFSKNVKNVLVSFGGISVDIKAITDSAIIVQTPSHDIGIADVTVVNLDDKTSYLLTYAYTYTCPPLRGDELLLLVLLAGALGGAIHALRSLYWYVGNRDLVGSWVLMYITLPFSGAAIAAVFFLIVRGGFLSAPPDREKSLFIIAIAALTGLFSQQAALKLQDIANAVLTKPGEGSNSKPQASESVGSHDKLGQPILPTPKIDPDQGSNIADQAVKITGVNFSSVVSVTFGGKPGSDLTFDPAAKTIMVKPPDGTPGAEVLVVVTGPGGQVINLKYKYI